MTEGVKDQGVAQPETEAQKKEFSDKELNFRRLEAAKEQEREARLRAEEHAKSMQRELMEIKSMLTPKEKDPLDDVEDFVDKDRLRAIREADRRHFQKEAKEIAKQTYLESQREYDQKNYLQRLKAQCPDYDQVMTQANLENLERVDPVFAETVLEIPDEYARCMKAYKKLKSLQTKAKDIPSIQDKVAENQRNPYFIPPDSGSRSGAVDFDVSSPKARKEAYAKLQAAQKRGLQ